MTSCFGVKKKFILNVILDTLEHTKRFNDVIHLKNTLNWNYFVNFTSINKNKARVVA